MTIDSVIETCLTALFKEDIFNESLYLKGGQALRLKEDLRFRFSADMDFSTPEKIDDEKLFFDTAKELLQAEFFSHDLYLFDFKFTRRPRIKRNGTPDFWSGWEVQFKLIEKNKRTLSLEDKRIQALVPEGSASPIIRLDISEHEYCGAVEKILVRSVKVNVYSRTLLLLEKIRALCQRHPEYKLTGNESRARDYYDIERLWNKVAKEQAEEKFTKECKKHISKVFSAKGVSLEILNKIFDPEFIEIQKSGWPSVKATVSGKLDDFEFYNEVLKGIVDKLK
jgi:predicted nucleotidyltransferase component of viral defense system